MLCYQLNYIRYTKIERADDQSQIADTSACWSVPNNIHSSNIGQIFNRINITLSKLRKQ